MPLYRISYKASGKQYSGVRASNESLDDYFMDTRFKVFKHHGSQNVTDFEVVQLSRHSREAAELNIIQWPKEDVYNPVFRRSPRKQKGKSDDDKPTMEERTKRK